jgi:hypothetical protein
MRGQQVVHKKALASRARALYQAGQHAEAREARGGLVSAPSIAIDRTVGRTCLDRTPTVAASPKPTQIFAEISVGGGSVARSGRARFGLRGVAKGRAKGLGRLLGVVDPWCSGSAEASVGPGRLQSRDMVTPRHSRDAWIAQASCECEAE